MFYVHYISILQKGKEKFCGDCVEKKKKLQITYTENENEDIITDHADIKKDKK